MKFNKQNWKEILLGDVVDHIEINERNPAIRAQSKFINVSDVGILDLRLKGFSSEEKPSFNRTVQKGQILFAKRWAISTTYPSKVAISNINGICSPHLWALETKNGLLQNLLPFLLQTNRFFNYCDRHSAGSLAGVYLKWEPFSNFPIKLPPLEQQKEILDLFLTLESQINNSEKQINQLKLLLKKLRDDLVNKDATFGSLINLQQCKKVTLGDVAYEARENTKTPLEDGIEKFIGLENIEPGNLMVQGFGLVEDGTTFTKKFQVGDVLFGRRRAYLKKTALADFKGICSGDITVLRSNRDLMLPELLPHYMSADNIFDFAVQTSAGSLSPRTKWKDLSKYELLLPDLDSQRKILDIFNSIVENINQNKDQRETLKKLKYKLLDEIFD
ncbi:restriction endonuclease subunit S [Schleiferiaceae bacterium]|nr:restriction endonuclease subunit S [Schleiferiaceae bacterium]